MAPRSWLQSLGALGVMQERRARNGELERGLHQHGLNFKPTAVSNPVDNSANDAGPLGEPPTIQQ